MTPKALWHPLSKEPIADGIKAKDNFFMGVPRGPLYTVTRFRGYPCHGGPHASRRAAPSTSDAKTKTLLHIFNYKKTKHFKSRRSLPQGPCPVGGGDPREGSLPRGTPLTLRGPLSLSYTGPSVHGYQHSHSSSRRWAPL